MNTYEVKFTSEELKALAEGITAMGELVGMDHTGTVTARFEAEDLWDVGQIIEGDVLHQVNAVTNLGLTTTKPEKLTT